MKKHSVLIVGGGPSGLRVAELLSAHGCDVSLFDQKPTVGRKWIVAGKGGLNMTHSEPLNDFEKRYSSSKGNLEDRLSLKDFSPNDFRKWMEDFGVETFVGSSGRVYPRSQSATQILKLWVDRLQKQGVQFYLKHSWKEVVREGNQWGLSFENESLIRHFMADEVVLAMGGMSWRKTGSDGAWRSVLERLGIQVVPWAVANCGWEVDWEKWFLEKFEGKPLKNSAVSTPQEPLISIRGDLMVTREGVEGTPVYTLTRHLRQMENPVLWIDLKPDLSADDLRLKFKSKRGFMKDIERSWNLDPVAKGLMMRHQPNRDLETFIALVKRCPLVLKGSRPLDEAISSAGGVALQELDTYGMLKKLPGIYCVGEMVDWEAPTGGYLLQGCMSTATRVARRIIFCKEQKTSGSSLG